MGSRAESGNGSKEDFCRTIFIDTSLNTHLAMIVSNSDTVSDLKKKVMLEHVQCFPNLGEIKIHALKVKRKGNFYHLSDSMLVKRAFEGAKRNWFLSIDASSLKTSNDNQHPWRPNVSNGLLCITYNNSEGTSTSVIHESSLLDPMSTQCTNQKVQPALTDSCKEISKFPEAEVKQVTREYLKKLSDSEKMPDLKMQDKCDVVTREGTTIIATTTELDRNNSLEPSWETGTVENKRRLIKKHNEDVKVSGRGKIASNHVPGGDASLPEIVGPDNSLVNARSKTNVEETLPSGPPAAKKWHEKKAKEVCINPNGKNNVFISDSNKETSQVEKIIPGISTEDQHDGRDIAVNGLSAGLPDDPHVRTESDVGKKKRKREPLDHVVNVLPSVQNFGRERSFDGNGEISHKDFGHGIHPEPVSEPSRISQKEGQLVEEVIELEVVPRSSIGTDICKRDVDKIKGKGDSSELAASVVDGLKLSKKCDNADGKEITPLNKDISHSVNENDVGDDQKISIDQLDRIEEEKELPLKNNSELMLSEKSKLNQDRPLFSPGLVNAEAVMESGNSGGSTRRKKRARKIAARLPTDTSSMDNEEGINPSGNEAAYLVQTQMRNDLLMNKVPKEPVLSSRLSEAKGTVECGKSGDMNRQKKRAKESSARNDDVRKHANNDLSGITSASKGFSETKKDEIISEDKEVSKQQLVNRSCVDGDFPVSSENVGAISSDKMKEVEESAAMDLQYSPSKQQANEVESLQLNLVDGGQKREEKMDKGLKKNLKSAATNNCPDFPAIEVEVSTAELVTSNDRMREVGNTSKRRKKTKPVEASPLNADGSSTEHISKTVDSVNVLPVNAVEYNSRQNKAKVDNIQNPKEDSKRASDGIDFKHYFMHSQPQNKVARDGKEREMKTKKNSKKTVLASLRFSSELPNSLQSNEVRDSGVKSHVKSSSGIDPQESFSKDVSNELLPSKKSSKVAVNEVKACRSHNTDQFKTPQPAKLPMVPDVSGNSSTHSPAYTKRNKVSPAVPFSSSKKSDKSFLDRKNNNHGSILSWNLLAGRNTSTKNAGEMVNGSQRRKSLLTTSGAIFRDDSSESSSDEDGTLNSDASTHTPSNNSSLSSSDGESESSLDSAKNVSNLMGGKKSGENTKSPCSPSDLKNITLDMIFRSSSRYKKAKLTAESQPEDTESQPVEVVPDSQPNL